MSPTQMKVTVFFTANGFIMTLFAIGAGVLYFYGQCLEPYVFGYPVDIPQPDQIWRGYIFKRETKREVEVGCFRFKGLRKLSPAVSPNYFFKVQAEHSEKINVSAYVTDADHQKSGEDLRAHPVGEIWNRNYCFEMPGTIGDEQALRVSGHAEHVRLLFGKPVFWTSETPTPEFVMKPTLCYGAAPLSSACS